MDWGKESGGSRAGRWREFKRCSWAKLTVGKKLLVKHQERPQGSPALARCGHAEPLTNRFPSLQKSLLPRA